MKGKATVMKKFHDLGRLVAWRQEAMRVLMDQMGVDSEGEVIKRIVCGEWMIKPTGKMWRDRDGDIIFRVENSDGGEIDLTVLKNRKCTTGDILQKAKANNLQSVDQNIFEIIKQQFSFNEIRLMGFDRLVAINMECIHTKGARYCEILHTVISFNISAFYAVEDRVWNEDCGFIFRLP